MHIIMKNINYIMCIFMRISHLQTENIAELMRNRMKIIERESSEDEDELEKLIVDAREKNKWDCQSILSTYSNIYNHPKLILDPPVSFR